jgi:hypothetical protein
MMYIDIYEHSVTELDALIATLYQLTAIKRDELATWYRLHYPRLTGDGSAEE